MSEQTNPIREAISEAISDNDVILFMKGTPDGPACGFSARAVAALQSVGTPFAAVDILPDPRIRQELSALSGWPTIPQLFVGGELLGGSDIIVEMYESGELAEAVGAEPAAGAEEPAPLQPQAAQPAPLGIENRLG
jgi:monothiol glutaredoxin